MKDWNFALPDPQENLQSKEMFQAMSDTLYTYLYSISKHNPQKNYDGTYVENWNYLYIDKNEEKGYKRYNASEVMRKLGIARATYYRRMETLKKYKLIKECKDAKGRRYFKIPFIKSSMILPVKTCAFFTGGEHRGFVPEDIIKLMAIIKILFYSDYKYFTMRFLRLEMGYSANHIDKNAYLRELLIILRGFGIVGWECQEIQLANNRKEIRYYITNFDDSYNVIMQNFKKDEEYCNIIDEMSEEERQKMFPIED